MISHIVTDIEKVKPIWVVVCATILDIIISPSDELYCNREREGFIIPAKYCSGYVHEYVTNKIRDQKEIQLVNVSTVDYDHQ